MLEESRYSKKKLCKTPLHAMPHKTSKNTILIYFWQTNQNSAYICAPNHKKPCQVKATKKYGHRV